MKYINEKRTIYFNGPYNDGYIIDEWTKDINKRLIPTKVLDNVDPSRKILKQNNTIPLDTRSMFPDLIIYITKATNNQYYQPEQDLIIGYYRIPINSMIRNTESRADSQTCGADLTIYHNIWLHDYQIEYDDYGNQLPLQDTGRCLPLTTVNELQDQIPGFLAFKLTLSELDTNEEIERLQAEEDGIELEHVIIESLTPLKRIPYHFATNIMQAKNIAGDPDTGLTNAYVEVHLMNLTLKSKIINESTYPMWFENLKNWKTIKKNVKQ